MIITGHIVQIKFIQVSLKAIELNYDKNLNMVVVPVWATRLQSPLSIIKK